MYPNLYYVFKDWFGVHWGFLKIVNSFGLMVALSFIAAAMVLSAELKRKERLGLLFPREEVIIAGKPAGAIELLVNAVVGFIFGFKLLGLFLSKPEFISTQEYIFSRSGNIGGGIALALILAGLKWYDRNKLKLKVPEQRTVRVWPHDRVGDLVILALVFGILGAKLFDNLEHWDEFIADPIGKLFSVSGLTFYGGLILAAVAIVLYAKKKGISRAHLADAVAPGLMIAYAVGRIGCQVAGDGDWGIYNSAYVSDPQGKISVAGAGDFERSLNAHANYFLEGKAFDSTGREEFVTDRKSATLAEVPHKSFKGPSMLPSWLFAYSYPQNVNNDGVIIPGLHDEHNRVIPQPVFPTPLYETIIGGLMFLFLWGIRKKIKLPWLMSGLYLFLNGLERFFVEMIRVNKTYMVFGMHSTQAEVIAVCLMLVGLGLIAIAVLQKRKVA